MNAGAVIVRELRAESRRPVNYWLRVLAAGALVLVFASIMLTSQPGLSLLGIVLFAALNQTFVFALWVLVPLMTADCISREKREGTLGLLFLTPLTVLDVIAGKVAIHVLRALTLFLGALPLLGLPLVLGGVDWRWLLMSAAGQANAVLLGIAAGIYASTRGGSAIQVMVLAEAWGMGLAVLTGLCRPIAMGVVGRPTRPAWVWGVLAIEALWAVILFIAMLRASVARLRQTWHEESGAPEQPRWVRLFSDSEFWQMFFHWEKSRTLNRNPVAWLQEYSWTARLTKWGCQARLRSAPVARLAAGLFELQRIGDDTSGQEWARTRKMGVNCLAFRAPQHGTFFAIDGDCAGQTRDFSCAGAGLGHVPKRAGGKTFASARAVRRQSSLRSLIPGKPALRF